MGDWFILPVRPGNPFASVYPFIANSFVPGNNINSYAMGLPEAKWEEKEMGIQKEEEYTTHESRQRTLSEFMS